MTLYSETGLPSKGRKDDFWGLLMDSGDFDGHTTLEFGVSW